MPSAPESESTESIPLTFGQKARLLIQCVPLAFFASVCAIYLVALQQYYGPPPLPFVPFMFVVLVAVGYGVRGCLHDVLAGVAFVRDDVVLERSWTRYGQHWAHHGMFEGLGRMRMAPKAFRAGVVGQHHRIVYSPRSRIVWSVEPHP
jgi:hypothetical protein